MLKEPVVHEEGGWVARGRGVRIAVAVVGTIVPAAVSGVPFTPPQKPPFSSYHSIYPRIGLNKLVVK